MVKTYKFECTQFVDGNWIPMQERPPSVTTETPTEAMNHPDIVNWCKEHNCRIARVVK